MVKETGCGYKGQELAKSRHQNTKVQEEILLGVGREHVLEGCRHKGHPNMVTYSPFQSWGLI